MSWLARRDREQFTGWIAGLPHRQWPPGRDRPLALVPYGVVTDVMVEDPAGHRTLYAPTRQLAEFSPPPTASTRSRSSPAMPAARARAGRCRPVPCSSRSPSDAAPSWDGCSGPCPTSWPEPCGWACSTFPPAGCCQGSAPVTAPATDVASGMGPRPACHHCGRRHPRRPWSRHIASGPTTGRLRLRLGAGPAIPGPPDHDDRGCPPWRWRRRWNPAPRERPVEGRAAPDPGQRRSASRFKAAPPAWG